MCGVAGVIQVPSKASLPGNKVQTSSASLVAYQALLMLQHRGQDGAGMVSYDQECGRFFDKKKLGLIAQAFEREDLERLKGDMALAHTRYATVGGDGIQDLQPMLAGMPFGVALAHNGNLANMIELAEEVQSKYKIKFLTRNDAEVLLQLFCYFMGRERGTNGNFNFEMAVSSMKEVVAHANGSYSVVGMVADGGLFALRDPHGIRPLLLGRKVEGERTTYLFASESSAIQFLGMEVVKNLAPGEFILITPEGQVLTADVGGKEAAHCMFEWVYFAGAESVLEGQCVYSARLELGRRLAKKISGRTFDVVMPVPDTGRTAAGALAEALKIPYREGLLKNRYVQRSFILNGQSKRELAVSLKLIPIVSEIKGKDILLVDDSIVRGTTSKKIVNLLRMHGAKSVCLALTCPPIKHPCFYGIDFPVQGELLMANLSQREAADWVGADEVFFTDTNDIEAAVNGPKLCKGCLTGEYPTDLKKCHSFALERGKVREKAEKKI
ncbi:MAG: amidophosphoribosyltransferase [Bdellovibrionales bacterium GWA2_49_15]|nr:MAG: amidophosphoribosyltransferase [Bdellovibrionales bacterium GWA2_49_15]HAZ13506.1 amidophosphoribosyltransferase [Bdellovibrionales bacterium]